MAKGHIPVASTVKCISNDRGRKKLMELDAEILRKLRSAVVKELDCQIMRDSDVRYLEYLPRMPEQIADDTTRRSRK
ncbi:hypothetical protein GTR04_4149 [Trichophyton interdigitale]|nr:hypothetical protein GY631_3919 [Trichophyton interdigitale]KAF3894594.1 hypothetical protein GY632_3685 [Trichophyton interdigitale]KAG8208483.1 hypothetical protein GTR04_4149 [Trichophyton interdigitale]